MLVSHYLITILNFPVSEQGKVDDSTAMVYNDYNGCGK